ncbi:hypothetical protein BDV96DRAFT_646727 [Lophiotrema nucula]|uniref:F-box domain-containing protein n=1 Tax=Lophiotrema nucula TaxID=690887 RepID=A0A6A5Z5W1_9PLEO|nr:hypothetical protein BDV96DRAFT_646727 [Lophiotrema nucula]
METSLRLPIELVLHVITCCLPGKDEILPPDHATTKTLVSFTLVCKETRRLATRYLREHCVYLNDDRRLRALLLLMPERPDLRKIHQLFLAPFDVDGSIDDQPTAIWVKELFNFTCLSLRRLVMDIPLRSVRPENDHLDVRRIMAEGFQRLESLEEFVSVQDELYLEAPHLGLDVPLWRGWPKLRRLALYNVDADDAFWAFVAAMPALETLVLTRADSLRDCNMKEEYRGNTDRPLKVLLVNIEDDQVRFGNMIRFNWDIVDEERKMTIMLYNVPGIYARVHPIEGCQRFVKAAAADGTLWDLQGEIVQHLPKIPHPNVAELP